MRSAPAHIARSTKGPIGVRHVGRPIHLEQLPRPLVFGGEYGTNGANLAVGDPPTASEDPINFMSLGAGNTLTYDTTHAHRGSQSIKVQSLVAAGSNSASYGWRGWRLYNQFCYCRLYFYLAAAPSIAVQLVRWTRDGVNALAGGVRITATGTLVAINSSNVTTGTPSATLPLNQWIRVETLIVPDPAAGQIETRAWWTSPDSTGTPDYDAPNTGIATGTGMIDGVQFGVGTNVTQTADFTFWIDDMAGPFFDWPGPAPVSGPVTNLLTLAASETAAAAITKQPAKLLVSSETASALLARRAAKVLAASETQILTPSTALLPSTSLLPGSGSSAITATCSQQTRKLIVTIDTPTATVTRRTAKVAAITEAALAVAARQTQKIAFAAETAAVTLGRIKATLLLLTATVTPTAALQRQTGKRAGATETAGAAAARQTAKTITASATPLVTTNRVVGKVTGASSAASAVVARVKTVRLLLAATSAATAVAQRNVGKVTAAATTPTATLARIKTVRLALTATTTASAVVQRVSAKTLTSGSTAAAVAARQASKRVAVAEAATASMARGFARMLAATVTATTALAKQAGKAGTAASAGATSLVTAFIRNIRFQFGAAASALRVGARGEPVDVDAAARAILAAARVPLEPNGLLKPSPTLLPSLGASAAESFVVNEVPTVGASGAPRSGAGGMVKL